MNHQDYYVYALVNTETERIFYIGKGRGNRCKQHLSDKKSYCFNKRLNGYIQKLKDNNIPIRIDKLHENLDEETSYRLEEELILSYGRKGFEENGVLMNILESGRPPSNKGKEHPWWGRKHSDETKEKLSRIMKEKVENGWNPNLGRKHPKEFGEKISASKKGKSINLTEEGKERKRQSRLGKYQTEKQKSAAKDSNSCWWEFEFNGTIFTTKDLKEFAPTLGLTYYALHNMIHCKSNCHPNLKITKISEKGGEPYSIKESKGKYK